MDLTLKASALPAHVGDQRDALRAQGAHALPVGGDDPGQNAAGRGERSNAAWRSTRWRSTPTRRSGRRCRRCWPRRPAAGARAGGGARRLTRAALTTRWRATVCPPRISPTRRPARVEHCTSAKWRQVASTATSTGYPDRSGRPPMPAGARSPACGVCVEPAADGADIQRLQVSGLPLPNLPR